MYTFQIYRNKSYRTIYKGKLSQATKRLLNGVGRRRVMKDKELITMRVK